MIPLLTRSLLASGCLLLTCAISPSAVKATCGEECDEQYSSDVDDCHSNYGDDPADADDLASCIQDARDNYGSCLDDCARPVVLSSFVGDGQCRAVSLLLHAFQDPPVRVARASVGRISGAVLASGPAERCPILAN